MRRFTPLLLLAFMLGLVWLYTLPARAGKMGSGEMEIASISSMGVHGNNDSGYLEPFLSADGRFVGYSSFAGNLVPNDNEYTNDGFIRDRVLETTTLITLPTFQRIGRGGLEALSADGDWLLLSADANEIVPTDTNWLTDVYLHYLPTGAMTRISVGYNDDNPYGGSRAADMSDDANRIVYESRATNAVENDQNGRTSDIVLYDRTTDQTTLVSVSGAGVQANEDSLWNSISADGDLVAFLSLGDNLVANDGEGWDAFVKNVVTGELRLVSVNSQGVPADGQSNYGVSLSANGRYVAFSSDALNLDPTLELQFYNIYVHDLVTGVTERVSMGTQGADPTGNSAYPVLSADGRYVAFASDAPNLVANDLNAQSDIFLYDRNTDTIELVTRTLTGVSGNDASSMPAISADGESVAFNSLATDLVMSDTNGFQDVFVYQHYPNGTPTPSPTATHTPIPTNTPTATATITASPSPTATMIASATPTATATPPTRYIYLPLVRRQ